MKWDIGCREIVSHILKQYLFYCLKDIYNDNNHNNDNKSINIQTSVNKNIVKLINQTAVGSQQAVIKLTKVLALQIYKQKDGQKK